MSQSNDFRHVRLRLTGVYLLIIMIISLIFSTVIYQLMYQEIDRHIVSQRETFTVMLRRRLVTFVPDDYMTSTETELRREAQRRILGKLAILNLFVLGSGGLMAYIFADKSLRPLEKAHDVQKRFASDAAHELRTPLAALKIENEILLRVKNPSIDDLRQQISSNIEEVDRLEGLSSSLLELAHIETAKLQTEQCNLVIIAKKCASNCKKIAQNRTIEIINSSGISKPCVAAHKQSVERIITILVDNAIKYSDEKSPITIEVCKSSNGLSVSIADKGIGIKKSDMPHIFDRFYRGEKSRSTNGYGLGLSLAKELARANDATLEAKSTPGEGSTFTLSFSN